ncbi:MAG: hypothetical protein ACOY3U_12800 [Bacillota bacterium]
MKTALKLFSGLVLGAFAFVLALAAPGTGSAEAYVSYDNTKSNYTNYSNKYYNLNSYKSTNTTYQKYNYGYNKTNTTNYRAYGYNHQKPSYSKPSQPAYNPGRTSQPSGGVSSADEQAMLNLINKERAAKGLKP